MDGVRWGDAPVRWGHVDVYAVGRYRMKAILVIDMPNELDVNDLLIDYCVHTKGEYKQIKKGGNYSLKQIPDCPDVPETISNDVAYILGWNDCIAEILRNENSKNR